MIRSSRFRVSMSAVRIIRRAYRIQWDGRRRDPSDGIDLIRLLWTVRAILFLRTLLYLAVNSRRRAHLRVE